MKIETYNNNNEKYIKIYFIKKERGSFNEDILFDNKISKLTKKEIKNIKEKLEGRYKKTSTIEKKIGEINFEISNYKNYKKLMKMSPTEKLNIKKLYLEKNWFTRTFGDFQLITENEFEKMELDHVYTSNSGSMYYIGKEGNEKILIRISDHWGYDIASCDWHLFDGEKNISLDDRGYSIGKIKLNNLQIYIEDYIHTMYVNKI